jgi:transposase
LGCDEAVAGKDRLYRALDKALEHRDALMGHLQERWSDLFGAECQILLYDLTSTYFEGEAEEVESAARGYSRDHRPDTLQIIVALVVTPEGFPVAYEVFDGDTADVTTLEEIVDKIESKYGMKGRVWVFDRGVVSEDNLQELRQRGAYYLVGTPRRKLANFERELLEGDWQEVAGKPGVRVQLVEEGGETFVLARSTERAKKESAMLRSQLVRLHRSLRRLHRIVATGRLKDTSKIERRLGRLEERYPQGWSMLSAVEHHRGRLLWSWNKARLRGAKLRQGAYLLRTNLDPMDPDVLWRQYVQLTEVEAAFRALKSELAIRPIWHRIQRRVEAHILVAFLGYCLWIYLKQKLKMVAESITPARALESLRSILMVEVWFRLRDGRHLCLPRITEPEKQQALLLTCPNSLRPGFIPINFKAIVWQTGAVPEKPSRSKSITYAIRTIKTAKLRLGCFVLTELDALAAYVAELAHCAEATTHAEDRSAYTAHLAAAAMLFAFAHVGRSAEFVALIRTTRARLGLRCSRLFDGQLVGDDCNACDDCRQADKLGDDFRLRQHFFRCDDNRDTDHHERIHHSERE